MVSKASEDFPDPERPVKTTSLSRGIERVTFLRLCSRAPRIVMWSVGIGTFGYPPVSCDRKRAAGGGDEAPARTFDPALGDRRPAPGVDHPAGRAESLAYLRRRDEADLQVETHRAHDVRFDGTQRAAHCRICERADHPAVDESNRVGHVLDRRHVEHRDAALRGHVGNAKPGPCARNDRPTHGPGPPAPAYM